MPPSPKHGTIFFPPAEPNDPMSHTSPLSRPPAWTLVLAFGLVYTSWGTTFLAIQKGVKDLPPGLFAGVRVSLAGLVLLGFLALRGGSVCLPRGELRWAAFIGVVMFVGGNGLLNFAERTLPSGAAAVLATTMPLWVALLETLWPSGERLRGAGWAGLALGSAGVIVLLSQRLERPGDLFNDVGPLLVLGSAFSWGIGSFALRHRRPRGEHLTTASYHMILGGGTMTLLALLMGEASQLTPASFTPSAVGAFFYLLTVGSLIGFLAYTWLLRHVSTTLVGTHAYVNPMVALVVGAVLNGEAITGEILAGMLIIFAGVALVRAGSQAEKSEVRRRKDESRKKDSSYLDSSFLLPPSSFHEQSS
jgi:drug/metabolite transporter (DMT)-like permease